MLMFSVHTNLPKYLSKRFERFLVSFVFNTFLQGTFPCGSIKKVGSELNGISSTANEVPVSLKFKPHDNPRVGFCSLLSRLVTILFLQTWFPTILSITSPLKPTVEYPTPLSLPLTASLKFISLGEGR